jgi:hypothetical protein
MRDLPEPTFEAKAREFRRLYRQMERRGEPWHVIKAEFEPIFGRPPERGEAEHTVTDAWTEARELAGWAYDYNAQCWLRADGSRVLNDDDSEWRHL